MATVSKSIRVADDRAAQFESIKNEFNSGAEFGDWIIEAYRMHQATKTEEAFSTDAKELEDLFARAINIFTNAAERTEKALKNKDASIKETIAIKEIRIEELGEEIGSLQEQIKQLNDELKAREDIIKEKDKVIRDTQKILDKAVEDLQTTKDLNKMLQEKQDHYIKVEELNETLVKEVDQLNEAHQKEVKGLNTQLNEAVRNVENTNVQLDKAQQEILRKDKEIEDTIEKYSDKINTLKEANVDKIQGLKDSHEVALDKVKVTKDMEINQLKVQVQQAKVDATEEAQKREKQFLGEMEELRKEIHQLKVSSIATPEESK